MLKYRTILHPTDFSEFSRYAFEVALSMAKACGSWLTVLHVREAPEGNGNSHLAPAPGFEEQVSILEHLIAHRPEDPSLQVTHHLVQGDAADEIVRMARKLPADLIVMGSHGRTGLQRLVIGSVAEEVAQKASCPVLIVRNGQRAATAAPGKPEFEEVKP